MEGLLKHGVVNGVAGTGNAVMYVFGMEVQDGCPIARLIQQMPVSGNNVAKQQIIVGKFIITVHGIVIHGWGVEKRDLQHPIKQ